MDTILRTRPNDSENGDTSLPFREIDQTAPHHQARSFLSVAQIPERSEPATQTLIFTSTDGRFSSWYAGQNQEIWLEPATKAFKQATEALIDELGEDHPDAVWLQKQNSINDVQEALQKAQREYLGRSHKSKVRQCLASCSSRIMYYAGKTANLVLRGPPTRENIAAVFDALSQHYPEYVSLAWGTMKFLFTVIINHEELFVKIARSITMISDVLPRADLFSILYPTEEVKRCVADVYAKIMEFMIKSIKWYKKGKLGHTVSAIIGPFKIQFGDILDEIAGRSRRIDDFATAASRAELRDIHIKINKLLTENQELRRDTFQMHQNMQTITRTLLASQALQQDISFEQMNQKRSLLGYETRSLSNAIESRNSGTVRPDQSLVLCRSMRNRRRLRASSHITRPELEKLRTWFHEPHSSILWANGRVSRTSSLDFAIDLLDITLAADIPVLWVLPPGVPMGVPISLQDILCSLVLRLLELMELETSSEGLGRGKYPTVQQAQRARTVSEWFAILGQCMRQFRRLVLIVDMDFIHETTADLEEGDLNKEVFLQELQEQLRQLDGASLIKVVLATWQTGGTLSDLYDNADSQTHIFIGSLFQERHARHPAWRGKMRRNAKMAYQEMDSIII